MQTVMRVQAPTMGYVTFSDDELLELTLTPVQRVVEERAQLGGLNALWLSEDMFQMDMVFRIYVRDTLAKLDQIRQLHGVFNVFPFLLEAPATSYAMIWTDTQFRERWVRGRMEANWDLPVTWKESRSAPCPAEVS